MRIAVVYVYPMVNMRTYFPLARRFAETYLSYPAGADHELHVICNGSEPSDYERQAFAGVPLARLHVRSNFGWDIGAFQWAAENLPCDLLVCLGANVHFHRAGWLARMENAYLENGPALYGCWAYLSPNWHVRTTCFWLPPQLLQSYPELIGTGRRDRYRFEHGNSSLTRHALKYGFPAIMVSWDGCFPFEDWGEHAPGPHESLVHDQFTHAEGVLK